MLKTVVIGASAHSTPALFCSPIRFDESTYAFTLMARNQARLAAVSRAIDVVADGHQYRVRQKRAAMCDLEAECAGADAIVVQIRTGGYAARKWDERFPLRYDQCGDEGLGLGGLAAAWRTWPELRGILERIAATKTNALILLLTSPVGILTRCALSAFPQLRLYGICELPWTTLVDICGGDAGRAGSAQFSYAGVNHIGWLSDVRSGERVLCSAADVVALKYVALEEQRERIVSEQRRRPSRAHELERLAESAFRTYTHGSPADVLAAVRKRSTPWYADAVAPLLAGLAAADPAGVFFLTQRNASYCSWLADDDVIEMPYRVQGSRLERAPLQTWARADIAQRLSALVGYEAKASDAVRRRDPSAVADALAEHPWLHGIAVDDALLEDVFATPIPMPATADAAELVAGA